MGWLSSAISSGLSARQAKKQRRWQTRMANTAHQREVKDLRAAGLNPILSATGGRGAVTPSGAMANMADAGESIVGTAKNIASARQELRNLKKQGNLLDAQTRAATAGGRKGTAEAKIIEAEVPRAQLKEKVMTDVTAEAGDLWTRFTDWLSGPSSTAKETKSERNPRAIRATKPNRKFSEADAIIDLNFAADRRKKREDAGRQEPRTQIVGSKAWRNHLIARQDKLRRDYKAGKIRRSDYIKRWQAIETQLKRHSK